MDKYILFDLDGTISESSKGITKSVKYCLESVNIYENDLKKLEMFIGPPLNVAFKEVYGLNSKEISLALSNFRDYYEEKGMFECNLYKGINNLLKACHEEGMHLAVASSKPVEYVRAIINHFKLTPFFDFIGGSDIKDEVENKITKNSKEIVIRNALENLKINTKTSNLSITMVGDRKFDIAGGRANKIKTIGVSYGYGSKEELQKAGADKIVSTVCELQKELLNKD